MKAELPRYRLTAAAYLQPARSAGASKFEAGAEVAFEGTPSATMVPLNASAIAAKVASIRAYGLGRLRKPSAGDRSTVLTLTASIGGHRDTVDGMVDQIEAWISKQDTQT